jgi:hypothetical protein
MDDNFWSETLVMTVDNSDSSFGMEITDDLGLSSSDDMVF